MNIIFGPPGTGKTTRLLEIVDHYIEKGVHPQHIGFLAFTKKAANEAKTRAAETFGFENEEMPWFRTIHSLAFKQLGLTKAGVFNKEHFQELSEILGFEIQGQVMFDEGAAYGMLVGDRVMFMENLARARMVPLRKQWEQSLNDEVHWLELQRAAKGYAQYKKKRGLIDFTDMLYNFVEFGVAPDLDVLIVDEAQDLSPLQWVVVDKIARDVENVYIAGDDDQAIFSWAGADPQHLVRLAGKHNTITLNQSYRIPKTVHGLAREIIRRIQGERVTKKFKARDLDGSIRYHMDVESVDMREGKWLVLARNGYSLRDMESICRSMGFSYDSKGFSLRRAKSLKAIAAYEDLRRGNPINAKQLKLISQYTPVNLPKMHDDFLLYPGDASGLGLNLETIWHKAMRVPPEEREYFIAARSRGETLIGEPRIQLSTIHGAKGGECENVVLLTDVARRTFEDMEVFPDNEHRVFYVGVTRAKENIHVILPKTKFSYDF